jgi:hypothetical protein
VSVPLSKLASPDPSPARECVPPLELKGGQHSLAGEGVGGTNSDVWRESLALFILCGPVPTYLLKGHGNEADFLAFLH